MLEQLDLLDHALFIFINVHLANPVTDFIMPIITNDWLLRIIYVTAMGLILWKGDRRLRWLVLPSVVVLLLTDRVSAGLLKPLIDRPRPCHEGVLQSLHLLVRCGGGMSMPSSHAANAFGQAVLFAQVYKRIRWPLITFAALVAISRVFVGVHYPGDVIAGSLLGLLIAWLVATVYQEREGWLINAFRA